MKRRARWCVRIALAAAMALAFGSEATAAVLHARNDGIDAPGCGTTDRPCRSIGAAVRGAAEGDRVVVGPGLYGDLNGNGVSDPGDETFDRDCGCLVKIDKRLTIESELGAAATIIDGGGRDGLLVMLQAAGVVFGKPGKGFTLTGAGQALQADLNATGVTVAGNHALRNPYGGFYVATAGSRLVRNMATQNGNSGFDLYSEVIASSNVAYGNMIGFNVQGDHAVLSRNLASGNRYAGFNVNFGPHAFTRNAAVGNRGPGLWIQVLYGPVLLSKNSFYGNDDVAGCGMRNSTGGTIDATGSYWGAATGAGDDPADRACDDGSSVTTTSPAAGREIGVKVPTFK